MLNRRKKYENSDKSRNCSYFVYNIGYNIIIYDTKHCFHYPKNNNYRKVIFFKKFLKISQILTFFKQNQFSISFIYFSKINNIFHIISLSLLKNFSNYVPNLIKYQELKF